MCVDGSLPDSPAFWLISSHFSRHISVELLTVNSSDPGIMRVSEGPFGAGVWWPGRLGRTRGPLQPGSAVNFSPRLWDTAGWDQTPAGAPEDDDPSPAFEFEFEDQTVSWQPACFRHPELTWANKIKYRCLSMLLKSPCFSSLAKTQRQAHPPSPMRGCSH